MNSPTLDGNELTVVNSDAILKLETWRSYEIDFSKVSTLGDVINILRGMQLTISLADDHGAEWAPILPYLKEKP